MSYVKILAPLTGGSRDANVLACAFEAARPFSAHVQALFVRPDATEAMPFFGEGVSGVVLQEIIDAAKEAADKAASEACAALRQIVADAGLTLTDKPQKADKVTVSWREMQGNFATQVTNAARLSDMVVFGPLGHSEKPGLAEAFDATLMQTGRPVLLSAHVPPKDFARHIGIGWDGSLACARALTAALPYLKRAEFVEVFTISQGSAPQEFGEVCEYLKLHDVRAEHRTIEAGARPVGEVLLESAAASRAGFLVLGGYGHTRLLQVIFGGVTRHVVSHSALPLFLMH